MPGENNAHGNISEGKQHADIHLDGLCASRLQIPQQNLSFFSPNTEKNWKREGDIICAKFRSEVCIRNGLVSPLTQLLIAYIIISCPVLLSRRYRSHQPHLDCYNVILHMLVCSTPMQSMKKAVLKFILSHHSLCLLNLSSPLFFRNCPALIFNTVASFPILLLLLGLTY